jgi:hypothetical protein
MANCIDPVVQQVKAPQLKPVVHRSFTEPDLQQLMAPDNPMLPPRQLRDHDIPRAPFLASLYLTPHIGVKDRLGEHGRLGGHGVT